MRSVFTFTIALLLTLSLEAQVIHNESSDCEIQVAFAISESEGTGEYTLTEFIVLPPGSSQDFREIAFARRQLFAGEDYEEMFIIRFPSSGITHFVNTNAADGHEQLLNGGCNINHMPRLKHDGEWHLSDGRKSR